MEIGHCTLGAGAPISIGEGLPPCSPSPDPPLVSPSLAEEAGAAAPARAGTLQQITAVHEGAFRRQGEGHGPHAPLKYATAPPGHHFTALTITTHNDKPRVRSGQISSPVHIM